MSTSTLTGHREPHYRFELLTPTGAPAGTLDGVQGGTLDYNANTAVKAGGKIEVVTAAAINWNRLRIRPWYVLDDTTEWPLGVFIPVAPQRRQTATATTEPVELLGKLTALDQSFTTTTLAYGPGTVVTDAVRDQVAAAGQTGLAITASSKTLLTAMVWPAGTSRLQIINELLASINYWSMWADGWGNLRADPYQLPSERPVRYEFLDAPDSIGYSPDLTVDTDMFAIPNRVIVLGAGSAGSAALVGTWDNTDPASPYSQPSRGYQVTRRVTGSTAVDQTIIDAEARRIGVEASMVASTVQIRHAPVPLDLNDVIRLRNTQAGIDTKHTVQAASISLDATALATATLREVVAL